MMTQKPAGAFKRMGLKERADLTGKLAKGASFASLVIEALKTMTPTELAEYCLAFEYLRPKQKAKPTLDHVLREVLTFDVQRVDGECALSPSQIYARYVVRCKEYNHAPLSLAWFGRQTRPLMLEVHGIESSRKHYGRLWCGVMLRADKPPKNGGKLELAEQAPAETTAA